MGSFAESMHAYRKLLKEGAIQTAYRGLMGYMRDLAAHFKTSHPEYPLSGIYYGFMDMTYFALFPQALKPRKLKISLVFLHEDFRFEVWLSGANRSVQVETWKRLKDSDYQGYRLAADPRREDYVMAHTLVAAPDFGDLDELTRRIASGTMAFILDVEGILAGI